MADITSFNRARAYLCVLFFFKPRKLYLYFSGLPYDLSEGDIITVFSQWGEVMNINLIRDRKSGKSKGKFCGDLSVLVKSYSLDNHISY